MNTQIQSYAESMYEQSLMESAVTVRTDVISFLNQRAARQTSDLPWSGVDMQSLIKIYVLYIERCMVARLDSYRKAFDRAGELPTDQDLTQIIGECETVQKIQVQHAGSSIANFAQTRGQLPKMDLEQALVAESAHGHDRVLQVWKVWRSEVGLQRSGKKAEEAVEPQPILVVTPEKQEPKHKTVLSYYWAFSKRLGLECYQTWRQELLASLLVATVFYFLSRRNDPAAWVNFKTAGLATAITLGVFAVAHSLRTPWLLHKDISKQEDEDRRSHWGHGLLGVIVIFTIVSSTGLYAAKRLLGPVSPDSPSRNQSENAARGGKTELAPSPTRPAETPYKEPKNSLRRRTVQLANDLDAFLAERSAKRPSNPEDARQFDQATINIYMSLYKSRTVGILQELRARGVDVGLLDAPGAAQSRFLLSDETRELRDLAYHLDDKGNMVHF